MCYMRAKSINQGKRQMTPMISFQYFIVSRSFMASVLEIHIKYRCNFHKLFVCLFFFYNHGKVDICCCLEEQQQQWLGNVELGYEAGGLPESTRLKVVTHESTFGLLLLYHEDSFYSTSHITICSQQYMLPNMPNTHAHAPTSFTNQETHTTSLMLSQFLIFLKAKIYFLLHLWNYPVTFQAIRSS